MYRDLKNRSPTVMGWVINLSVFICFSFYALIGITGYLSFANLEKFPDNILNVFPPNDVAIVIAKVFIFIVVVLSYPLVHYAGLIFFNFLISKYRKRFNYQSLLF